MKKLLAIILIIIFSVGFDDVYAISKDVITKDDNISIPWFISSSGSKITVYNSEDYDLYAEWLEISMDKYNEITNKTNECKAISDASNEYSKKNRPSRDSFTNNEDYSKAVEIYNAEITKYKEKYNTCTNEYYESVPNFDDSKWDKLTNDTVYLPSKAYSGTKPFILYVKLDDYTNSLIDYEFAILELDGDEENGGQVTPDIDDGDDKNDYVDEEIPKDEAPKTGYYIPFIFLIISILLILFSKKVLNNRKIFKV